MDRTYQSPSFEIQRRTAAREVTRVGAATCGTLHGRAAGAAAADAATAWPGYRKNPPQLVRRRVLA